MALDPLTLTLGLVFVGATIGVLIAQWITLRGARILLEDLRGQEGEELMRIIHSFIRTVFIGQVMAALVIVLYSVGREGSQILRLALVVGQQVLLLYATAIVLVRARGLRDKTPVNGSGEAVVEAKAQAAAEVEVSTGDEGASVDDGSRDNPALPAKLDERPAG
jgi:hypothetical protein